MFSPKPDGQTYGLTDISIYRVALLLKNLLENALQNGTISHKKIKLNSGHTRKVFKTNHEKLF